MIPRYSRPEMTAIWSETNKYKIWYEIEAYAVTAQEELGIVPKGTSNRVWGADPSDFDIDKINRIEKLTKHDE